MISPVYFIACALLIACSAFFSASEMAFSSANRLRLENAMDAGSKKAKAACMICDRFDDALSAILIGNNLVNIATSSLASVIAILTVGEEFTPVATAIVTVLVIIFGETIPKVTAKRSANKMAMLFAYPIRALTLILTPVVWVVVKLTNLTTAPFKGEDQSDSEDDGALELQSIIETAEDESVIDEERSELLQAALDFAEVSVSEVMTARVDMTAIDIDDDYGEIIELINASPYSRLPVYEGSVDNIIGTLYLNHVFKALTETEIVDIRSLLMEPCYVYKTVKLPAVLSELRRRQKHLAIVTDEYGGTLGIVTLEDVLEQIVGDIWDETDEIEDEVVEHSDGEYEVDGDLPIGEFLELIGREEDLFETESATVGGWTMERFGGFPEEGQRFTADDMDVTVLKMDGKRVERILVRVEPEEED